MCVLAEGERGTEPLLFLNRVSVVTTSRSRVLLHRIHRQLQVVCGGQDQNDLAAASLPPSVVSLSAAEHQERTQRSKCYRRTRR